jgi:hypothetical protein
VDTLLDEVVVVEVIVVVVVDGDDGDDAGCRDNFFRSSTTLLLILDFRTECDDATVDEGVDDNCSSTPKAVLRKSLVEHDSSNSRSVCNESLFFSKNPVIV